MQSQTFLKCCYLLGITGLCIAGCTSRVPIISPLEPPSVLPTPTWRPTETTQPAATSTAMPQPGPAPSPLPSPTATYLPYNDVPFTIIFLRNGNLWSSEIGGGGERQITHEPAGWPIRWYDVSPKCDRIAYISSQDQPGIDALVKQVVISNGSVSVLTGENDPYSEYNVEWLDSTHITFQLQEYQVPRYSTDNAWQSVKPFHHIVFDLTTGKRTFIPESLLLSQSPNGRYWLTCSRGYVYEGACTYKLHDLTAGKQWAVAKSIGWGNFIEWSPDNRQMLFDSYKDPTDATAQLVVITVTVDKEQPLTPNDKTVMSASWSPDGRTIAFAQCDVDHLAARKNCALWLVNNDGSNARMIPVNVAGEAMNLAWTPDGSRLVFTIYDTPVIWSVGINGTDLRPVVSNAGQYQILCKNK